RILLDISQPEVNYQVAITERHESGEDGTLQTPSSPFRLPTSLSAKTPCFDAFSDIAPDGHSRPAQRYYTPCVRRVCTNRAPPSPLACGEGGANPCPLRDAQGGSPLGDRGQQLLDHGKVAVHRAFDVRRRVVVHDVRRRVAGQVPQLQQVELRVLLHVR